MSNAHLHFQARKYVLYKHERQNNFMIGIQF